METEIRLGDTVQDIHTGFEGVATNKTEFINGCIQFGVVAKFNPKTPIPLELQEQAIDSQSLKLIKKGPRHPQEVKKKRESTGGPTRIMPRIRGR